MILLVHIGGGVNRHLTKQRVSQVFDQAIDCSAALAYCDHLDQPSVEGRWSTEINLPSRISNAIMF